MQINRFELKLPSFLKTTDCSNKGTVFLPRAVDVSNSNQQLLPISIQQINIAAMFKMF